MVRKIINTVNGWLEGRLRRVCAPLSPDARMVVILSMLFVFSMLSIWMTYSAIYHFGEDRAKHLQLEHIERLELELLQKRQATDSLKQVNEFNDGKD